MLRELRQHVEYSIRLIEIELSLADPVTHTDEEHDFLIKKARMFRDSLKRIDERLLELD